jgi:5-methylcytosine-specific restriction endonuclease McrA
MPAHTNLIVLGLTVLIGVRLLDERGRAQRARARRRRQQEYREYLRSVHWQQMRQKILVRSRGFCEDCGARTSLDVHHKTYKRRGRERPEDLVALCRNCHHERHRGKRTTVDWIVLRIMRRWKIWGYERSGGGLLRPRISASTPCRLL